MKKAWLSVLLVALSGAFAADGDLTKTATELAQQVRQNKGDPAAVKALLSKVIDALAAKETETNEPARKDPQTALDKIEFIVSRPKADSEREEYCRALAERVSGVHAPAKIWILKSLERIGKAESVAAEVAMLSDANEVVRETARRALAANPSEQAAAALRKAVEGAADAKTKASLIEALGFKRDKADAALFEKEAANADAAVRAAALGALAAQGVRKDSGPQDEAAKLIEMGRAGKNEDIPALIAGLESPSVKVRQAAVQALNLNSSSEMTAALVAKLTSASVELKPPLILVLAQRGGTSAIGAFKAELGNPEAAVRVAALQGLGAIGDAAAVTPLMTIAMSKQGEEQKAARESLERLRGEQIDAALVLFLTDSNPALKIEAAQRLAGRNASGAAQSLLKMLNDADKEVRIEALKSLAAVGGKDELGPVTLYVLKAESESLRDQAAKTMVAVARRLPDPEGRADLAITAYKDASEPAKIALLNALGQIGGKRALDAVHAAMKEGGEKVQEAAFRSLAGWIDAAPMLELRDIARNSENEKQHVLALRGFVRMAGLQSSRSPAETLALFNESVDALKSADDKKLFLSGLADVKDAAALDTIVKFVAEPPVAEEACAAIMKVARNFENSGKLAGRASVLKYVLSHSKNKQLKDQAQALLDKLAKK